MKRPGNTTVSTNSTSSAARLPVHRGGYHKKTTSTSASKMSSLGDPLVDQRVEPRDSESECESEGANSDIENADGTGNTGSASRSSIRKEKERGKTVVPKKKSGATTSSAATSKDGTTTATHTSSTSSIHIIHEDEEEGRNEDKDKDEPSSSANNSTDVSAVSTPRVDSVPPITNITNSAAPRNTSVPALPSKRMSGMAVLQLVRAAADKHRATLLQTSSGNTNGSTFSTSPPIANSTSSTASFTANSINPISMAKEEPTALNTIANTDVVVKSTTPSAEAIASNDTNSRNTNEYASASKDVHIKKSDPNSSSTAEDDDEYEYEFEAQSPVKTTKPTSKADSVSAATTTNSTSTASSLFIDVPKTPVRDNSGNSDEDNPYTPVYTPFTPTVEPAATSNSSSSSNSNSSTNSNASTVVKHPVDPTIAAAASAIPPLIGHDIRNSHQLQQSMRQLQQMLQLDDEVSLTNDEDFWEKLDNSMMSPEKRESAILLRKQSSKSIK
jgi:trimeric autotransporter adhesin